MIRTHPLYYVHVHERAISVDRCVGAILARAGVVAKSSALLAHSQINDEFVAAGGNGRDLVDCIVSGRYMTALERIWRWIRSERRRFRSGTAEQIPGGAVRAFYEWFFEKGYFLPVQNFEDGF